MAVDPEVLGGPDSATPPSATDSGAKPGGEAKKESESKPDGKAEAKATREHEREIAELKTQLAEKDQAALHWYNVAQGVTRPKTDDDDEPGAKPAKPAKVDDDDESPDRFVDKLATLGPKALDEYMAKRGFMSGKQVQELLNGVVGKITREADLYAKYPDLRNEESELFKETQREFQDMVALDKSFAKNPVAVQLAARNATTRLKMAAEIADAKKPKETEAERRARAAAAGGDPGRGGGAEFEDDSPGELSPMAKDMLAKMNQAGGGPDIDPDKLLKRMAGRGFRQMVPIKRDFQGRFQ